MSGLRTALMVAGLSLALASCGGDDPVTQLADAADRDGDAVLDGFVVVRDGTARLCEVLMESFPPQCGDPSVVIANIEAADLEFTSADSTMWTDLPVTLSGTLDDGVLTIDDTITD